MAFSLPAAFIVSGMSCGAVAGERATAEEAQAMVARAGKTAFIKMTANKA
jgi:hypothetical protein